MDDDEIARAHIKGQLQGLRAALRQQPNGVSAPAASIVAGCGGGGSGSSRGGSLGSPHLAATATVPTPAPAPLPTVHVPLTTVARPYQPPPPAGTPYHPPSPLPLQHQPPAVAQPPRRNAVSPRLGRQSVGGPRAASPTPGALRAASPVPGDSRPASGTPAKGPKKGNKSDCVAKVEEMQRLRDERRRLAEEKKAKRLEDAKDAEGRGGIESVDFLKKINVYREANSIGEPQAWNGGNVWEDEAYTSSSIRVCVRKRPMLRVEQLRHDFDVICAEAGHSRLVVMEPKTKVDLTKAIEAHRFTFDAFFNEVDGNESIYNATLAPLLEHVFLGGHATVFAFGQVTSSFSLLPTPYSCSYSLLPIPDSPPCSLLQTGSGKTCTMAGHGDHQATDGNCYGLYRLAAHDVVAYAARRGVSIGVSFFEVYRGQALDLLGERARLEVLEDGKGRIQIMGLAEVTIQTADELLGLVHQAEELRAVGATSANEQSSRSHAILQVVLRDHASGHRVGKLSLVDLAGSERAADASSKDRQTRIEGAEINKSLLCLKECIRSLDSGSSHTPFRGSKLTQVLRDSFVGNSKTVMIATVSPGSSAAENTLNTLRYAQRVKEFSAKRPPAANRRASGAMPPAAQPLRAAGNALGVVEQQQQQQQQQQRQQQQQQQAPHQQAQLAGLPEGWSSAIDPARGKEYYISPKNETTWDRPQPPPPPPPPPPPQPVPPQQPLPPPPQQQLLPQSAAPAPVQQPHSALPHAGGLPPACDMRQSWDESAQQPAATVVPVPQPPVELLSTVMAAAAAEGCGEVKLPSAPNSSRVAAAEEAAIDEALGRSLKGRPDKAAGGADVEEVGLFFKSVAAVSRAEDVLVAQHKEAVEADELLLTQEKMMLGDLVDPDGCSVDEYAAALEKVLAAKFRICSELQQRLDSLKRLMADEEALSARVKQVPLY